MPQLKLFFQNVSQLDDIPSKQQFKKWAAAAIKIDTEVTIRVVDLDEGRQLNRTYRAKDYATNVLTFPISEHPHLLGDIIICAPVVILEAQRQHKTKLAHFAHLTVHGILHLHGYDHLKEKQAELMELIEVTTLQKLGYANPYLFTQDA